MWGVVDTIVPARRFSMAFSAVGRPTALTSRTPVWNEAWGQLAAMAFGFFFIRLLYIPAFNKFFMKRSMKKVSKKKSHLSIVRGHDEGDNGDDGPTMYH